VSFRNLLPRHSMRKDRRGLRPVGSGGGLFRSNDHGETSSGVGPADLPAGAVTQFMADPNYITTFYTMTLYAGLPGQGVSCTTSEQFVEACFLRLSRMTGSFVSLFVECFAPCGRLGRFLHVVWRSMNSCFAEQRYQGRPT
jgi:hypothetical protein